MILNVLKLQEVSNKDLDDPQTTLLHSKIIKKKLFLRNIYKDFYLHIKKRIGKNYKDKFLVEIGSGGGFIKEIIPNVITSDVMKLSTVDMHFSALKMPFKDESVDRFVMIDVMHHIPDAKKFFREMARCLKKNGKIIMIEPANNLWSSLIYRYFHHELFDPKAGWKFTSKGPLSSSNLALPWIVFFRDRNIFHTLLPQLQVKIETHTPILYLLSGGLSYPQLVPLWTYGVFYRLERLLRKLNPYIGMFYTIEIEKTY